MIPGPSQRDEIHLLARPCVHACMKMMRFGSVMWMGIFYQRIGLCGSEVDFCAAEKYIVHVSAGAIAQ